MDPNHAWEISRRLPQLEYVVIVCTFIVSLDLAHVATHTDSDNLTISGWCEQKFGTILEAKGVEVSEV